MSFLYNRAKKEIQDGTIDLLGDTLKVMLVTAVYTPNPDHDVVDAGGGSDPADAELTGSGYTAGWGGAGRKTLAGKTITEDDGNDRAAFDANDPAWPAIQAGTAAAALIIKEGVANDTTSRLIACLNDGGFPKITNGGDFSLVFNAAGIWAI